VLTAEGTPEGLAADAKAIMDELVGMQEQMLGSIDPPRSPLCTHSGTQHTPPWT
jgi:hypothetical protein